ncbi:MAG: hypothetical protein WAU68_08600 [Vitreimonas sp.]
MSHGLTVPYPPFFSDNRTNRGFSDLRGRPDVAAGISECADAPALRQILVTLAQSDSPLFTLGCDLGSHTEDLDGDTQFVAGGYVHIIDTTYWRRDPEDYRRLAEAVESGMHEGVGEDTWQIYPSLTCARMRLDSHAFDIEVPLLDFAFFSVAQSSEDALRSRERLLESALRAIEGDAVRELICEWRESDKDGAA